jgi:DNA-directed RNA polymerase specialized sigma24 family protein
VEISDNANATDDDRSCEVSDGSITRLIPGVRAGDELAIAELWRRYAFRVRGVAKPIVQGLSPGAGDVDDVAQSTFDAFFDAAATGRAPNLEGRDDLWRLLATISRRKATDRVRRETRQRRGGGGRAADEPVANMPAAGPTPSAEVALQELLDKLMLRIDDYGDGRLKVIAVLRLEGAATDEIAAELGCTRRTVQRKLQILERLWTGEKRS